MRTRRGKHLNTGGQEDLRGYILQDLAAELTRESQILEAAQTSDYVNYQKYPERFIREILGEKFLTPDQCKVLRSVVENPITILESANAVGKSHIMPRIGVWFYKVFPGAQVYSAAAPPEDNLRRILWGEFGKVIENNPSVFAKDNVKLASLEVKRSPLEFITGVTIPQAGDDNTKKARFAGKHAPFLLFLIDEGDALPMAVYEAIESCMSGGHARLVISYNPRSKNNPVYLMGKSGSANVINLNAFNHPNVRTGKDLVPGAVTREMTCRRIMEWTRLMVPGESLDNTFEVPEFLIGYQPKKQDGKTLLPPVPEGRRKVIQPEFSYMVLGRATSMADNQLIDRSWCEAAMDRYKKWVERHGQAIPNSADSMLGLDVAEFGNDFSVLTIRNGSFVRPQIVWGGVDISQTARTAEYHYIEVSAEEIFVDSNGLGAGVWSALREKEINAHRIMVQGAPTDVAKVEGDKLGEFERIRDQMWWAFREWLRLDPNAMLPTGETETPNGLIDQLCSASYMRNPNTNKIKICSNDVMKEKLGGKSPDHATSLVLTFAPRPDDEDGSEVDTDNYMY